MKKIIYIGLFVILSAYAIADSIPQPNLYMGDINNDGRINMTDRHLIGQIAVRNILIENNTIAFCKADINGDHIINVFDILAFARGEHIGRMCMENVIQSDINIDINGDGIFLSDDSALLAHIVAEIFTPEIRCKGDFNNNGRFDAIDILYLEQYRRGIRLIPIVHCSLPQSVKQVERRDLGFRK